MIVNVSNKLGEIVDKRDAREAGRFVDCLRKNGWTYDAILVRVRQVRPYFSVGDWEDLIAEAEELEAQS